MPDMRFLSLLRSASEEAFLFCLETCFEDIYCVAVFSSCIYSVELHGVTLTACTWCASATCTPSEEALEDLPHVIMY